MTGTKIFILFPLETGKKVIKLNALPTINLPLKSHETIQSECRVTVKCVQNETFNDTSMPVYANFQELSCRIEKLKLNGWTISKSDSSIILTFKIAEIRIPKLEIFINKSLELTYFVFGWRVPVICKLVDKYALNTVTISNL